MWTVVVEMKYWMPCWLHLLASSSKTEFHYYLTEKCVGVPWNIESFVMLYKSFKTPGLENDKKQQKNDISAV